MKRITVILFIFSVLTFQIHSEDTPEAESKPEEPEIVLPPVILNIEDLVVEKVEAGLPEEEELLPPEREISLPDVSALKIEEPELKGLINVPGIVKREKQQGVLNAEGTLGIGSMNHVLSNISLYKLGDMPRFKLSFNHEMLDGFGYNPAGSGYSLRKDSLEGFFRAERSGIKIDAKGSFKEIERGYQGKSNYISGLDRFAKAEIGVSKDISEKFNISGSLNGNLTSLLLSGNSPVGMNEYLISPIASASFKSSIVEIALSGDYIMRAYSTGILDHSVGSNLSLKVDLPLNLNSSLDVGWFWSSSLNHILTFDLSLGGSPLEAFSFFLKGGYTVRRHNLFDLLEDVILTDIPVSLPLKDDIGWLASGNVRVNIFKNLVFSLGLDANWYSAMPDLDITTSSGSFSSVLQQTEAFRFTSATALNWSISNVFTFILGWRREFADRPLFVPLDSLNAELLAEEPGGRYGGNLTAEYDTGFTDFLQFPVINLGGFYRFSENLRLMIQLNDILQVPGLHRYNEYSLEEPGFRGSVEMQINF